LLTIDDLLLLDPQHAKREGGAICWDGEADGFVFYGPCKNLQPGPYVFEIDIEAPVNPSGELRLDVYSKGSVLSALRLHGFRLTVKIGALLPPENATELRLYSAGVPVKVKAVRGAMVDFDSMRRLSALADEDLIALERDVMGLDGPALAKAVYSNDQLVKVLFSRPSLEVITIDTIVDHADVLRGRGIDPTLARALFEDVGYERAPGETPDSIAGLISFPDTRHSHQTMTLRGAQMECRSPVSGQWEKAVASVPLVANVYLPVVYEFAGENPMLVIGNVGWGSTVAFVWCVRQDVILVNDRNWAVGHDWKGLFQLYINVCLAHRDALQEYRRAEKRTAIVSGYRGNMGHYFWNDVSGLEREWRLGNWTSDIPTLTRPNLWLRVERMYPERAASITETPAADVLERTLKDRLFLISLSGSAIDADLAERVRVGATSWLELNESAMLEAHKAALARNDFCLFVNLRAHDKVWVEQREGIIDIIDAAHERFGKVLVYLDGMPDCRSLIEEFIAARGDSCEMIDGTSAPFELTLAWAYACDFFIAVIGSGLVPLTWLADRPGLCHANHGHLEQLSFWPKVRVRTHPLAAPKPEDVEHVTAHYYTNYHLAPSTMRRLFLEALEADSMMAHDAKRSFKDMMRQGFNWLSKSGSTGKTESP